MDMGSLQRGLTESYLTSINNVSLVLTDDEFSSNLSRQCGELSVVLNETVPLVFWKGESPDEYLSLFHIQREHCSSQT